MKRFLTYLREQAEIETMNGMRISRSHYEVHGIHPDHLEYLTSHPQVKNAEPGSSVTLPLPDHLPPLKSALVGPSVGDPPVTQNTPGVHTANRGDGRPDSRMIHGEHRPTGEINAVVIPDHTQEGRKWLVTTYGGPAAPREPGDPSLKEGSPEHKEAKDFWRDHALLTGEPK